MLAVDAVNSDAEFGDDDGAAHRLDVAPVLVLVQAVAGRRVNTGMSSFTDELTITEVALNWRVWRLEQDFSYEVGDKGTGKVITVPKGFETDGASVPQFLWSLFPAWGSYSRAAVIHDLLCHLINCGVPHPEAPTRRDADLIFLEAMKVCGTGPVTRTILYGGARLGGYLPGKNIVDVVNLAKKASAPPTP